MSWGTIIVYLCHRCEMSWGTNVVYNYATGVRCLGALSSCTYATRVRCRVALSSCTYATGVRCRGALSSCTYATGVKCRGALSSCTYYACRKNVPLAECVPEERIIRVMRLAKKMVNRLYHWSRSVQSRAEVQTDLSPFGWIHSVRSFLDVRLTIERGWIINYLKTSFKSKWII